MATTLPSSTKISFDPQDKLDASNCRQLINGAKAACQHGYQQIVIDMSQVKLISNCGLLTLNVIAEQLNKTNLPPVQLTNLQPHIKQALKTAGFYNYAE